MRSVVITGVSRGLGAALFDQCYDRGDRLLAIGRAFTDGQRELAEADPHRVLLRHADLTDPLAQPDAVELATFLRGPGSPGAATPGAASSGIAAGTAGAASSGVAAGTAGGAGARGGSGAPGGSEPAGGHAVLILNAAVVTPIGAVGELSATELAASVAVNLAAPMVLTNAFLAATAGHGEGEPPAAGLRRSVLFISSGAARRVIGGWAAYCAAKAGAAMFFRALAEQEGDRTAVVEVDPGVMDTGMQAQIRDATGYFPQSRRFHDRHAAGELADPAEVARMIIKKHLTDE